MGSDGAAGLVLASGAKARALGLHVIAKLRGYADAEQVFWIHQPATTLKNAPKISECHVASFQTLSK